MRIGPGLPASPGAQPPPGSTPCGRPSARSLVSRATALESRVHGAADVALARYPGVIRRWDAPAGPTAPELLGAKGRARSRAAAPVALPGLLPRYDDRGALPSLGRPRRPLFPAFSVRRPSPRANGRRRRRGSAAGPNASPAQPRGTRRACEAPQPRKTPSARCPRSEGLKHRAAIRHLHRGRRRPHGRLGRPHERLARRTNRRTSGIT
jgi:hypothetical protein